MEVQPWAVALAVGLHSPLSTLTAKPPLVWEGGPRLARSESESWWDPGTSRSYQSRGGPQHKGLCVGVPGRAPQYS